MVPLGPRLVLITSWRPLAPLMFSCRAWAALATSAFGFSAFTAIIRKLLCQYTRVHVRMTVRMRKVENSTFLSLYTVSK